MKAQAMSDAAGPLAATDFAAPPDEVGARAAASAASGSAASGATEILAGRTVLPNPGADGMRAPPPPPSASRGGAATAPESDLGAKLLQLADLKAQVS